MKKLTNKSDGSQSNENFKADDYKSTFREDSARVLSPQVSRS